MYVLSDVMGGYVCLCYGILWVSDGAFKIRIVIGCPALLVVMRLSLMEDKRPYSNRGRS